jgi:hypothetical protein
MPSVAGNSGDVDADVHAGASGSGQAGTGEPRVRFVPGTSAPQKTPPLDCGIDGIALENAGPPQNRVNFVIVGDGYDASAVDHAYLDQLAWAMQTRFSAPTGEPYLRYRKFVNICAFKVVSATNGIGNGPTAFSCTGSDSTRLILCNTGAAEEWLDQHLPPDFEVDWRGIVLNTQGDWGAGAPWALWSGARLEAPKVALHEGGHNFHELADEYSEGVSDDCFEFPFVNRTVDPVNTDGKWKHWLGYEAPEATGVQCLFQGSEVCRSGPPSFVPSANSIMQNLYAKDHTASFNSVSREKIIFDIWRITRPIDLVDPPEGNIESPGTLRVYVIDPEVISVDWSVDDELIATNAGTSYDVAASGLSAGRHVISARAYDNAPRSLVRARSGVCADSKHCWNRDAWKNSEQVVTWTVRVP